MVYVKPKSRRGGNGNMKSPDIVYGRLIGSNSAVNMALNGGI
jgi:hypothetical protein